ncbi:GNAT family N-acetyltransferase [Belnapia sp. F-4-1]|uniref:GNAT family N-acetyltransferase n=1 Tax=Belnapia sp. F-4-1 TaxID=1545443 RepID=UPI0006919E88|nr:GNAT family N-acetyltransferase [Belnapia sp. F-4-1]
MTEADLPGVVALAAAAHPHYPEEPAVFAERLALAPGFCWVLEDGRGYALAHPWAGPVPPLDSLLGALPAAAEALHLHDIVLAPEARGAGGAAAMIERLAALGAASGLERMTLVAVAGKAGYWRRLGFVPLLEVASYGAGAVLMARPLR